MNPRLQSALALLLSALPVIGSGSPANRLTYLDESDPFYPHLNFPRLTTPQWVGEEGVEAVVILAIDDLREPQKYELFLRPILERLKKIDGRAPVSILCNALDPQQAQFQTWLQEGLSLEVHTLSHPCPLLARNNFTAAAETYHGCVDLLNRIAGNRPVAFRMPCCDSMNSPSPRFYAEIFNRTNSAGQFLTIDSSVMNLTTSNDRTLPRDRVLDADGREKFRKYVPFPSFVTTIEDYPYPYVIGRLCWEFPAMAPSDWEAQNLHGTNHPGTVADWKAALDVTVIKQGTFTFIFHPHGWIRPDQLVEFVDYAVEKYGGRVKFLNFREAQERLDGNLLAGHPLRARNGQDNGARLLDLNNDGYLDVVTANEHVRRTRLWDATQRRWLESAFPVPLVTVDEAGGRHDAGVRFGVVDPDGHATILVGHEGPVVPTATATTSVPAAGFTGAWHFTGTSWQDSNVLLAGLHLDGKRLSTAIAGTDNGVRFRDLDHDGRCELIVSNDRQNAIFSWSAADQSWSRLPYALPSGTSVVDERGQDNGLRLEDLNGDGHDDVVFSNPQSFGVHLFIANPKPHLGWDRGWSFKVAGGTRGEPGEIPMIVRGGSNPNNGVWFHSGHMWVQNEQTDHLPDKVDRRSFAELITAAEPPTKSPEESLSCIRPRPGFKVELVASEPLVIDPVAFDWGPDGKLWIVEMRDYPLGLDGQGKPGGVIKYLEDTNDDGRYDKATAFLEGVNFPNGVMPWRGGVLVSAAPEIFYAADTDGDGKADLRRRIVTGFAEGNQQHRINGFDYGLDNWLYAANGGSGGKIRSELTGQTANLRGHDLRFKPDTGEIELVAGQTQFGRRRDDWGNWFGNENPTWLWHYVVPEKYLGRNPELAVETTRQVLANYPNPTRVFPLSRPQQRFNWTETVNHLTSANSPAPCRDPLFGPEFATSVFMSEPAHNLVHREILRANGVTFTSQRADDEQDREFLASSDNWFRPTTLRFGPDGALYIADMYRRVIEHPEYFPDELKTRPDLRAGDDRGRIYRVYPEGAMLRPIPRLDTLDVTGLLGRLASANAWERDMAQRLLIQRSARPPESALLRIVTADPNPKVRLQVLSTLEGLGMLTPKSLDAGLGDAHAAVREFAVGLAEPFLNRSPTNAVHRSLAVTLLRMLADPDIRVRRQLAFTFGEWDDPRAGQALVRLALRDRDDRHMQTAVLSSAPRHVAEMVNTLFAEARGETPPAGLLTQLIHLAVASGDQQSLGKILSRLAKPIGQRYAPWQVAATAGFLDALDRRGLSLKRFEAEADAGVKTDLAKLAALFDQARKAIDSSDRPASETEAAEISSAIRLLARGQDQVEQDIERLGTLLQPRIEATLQRAALACLKRLSAPGVGPVLLKAWTSYGPALRTDVLNALLSRPEWTRELLSGIESGHLDAGEIGPAHQQQLLKHSDATIRDRAQTLLVARTSDRQKIVQEYQAVTLLTGDPERGATSYRQNCQACHQLRGEGNSIGPDLGTVAGKSIQTLLVGILDPNQAFESRYASYTALTRDAREFNGIIVAETPSSITLRNVGGTDEVILRGDLKDLTSSRLSFMPEGFESIIKPQEMADLIAYIRTR